MRKIITTAVFVSSIGGFVSAQNPVLVKDIDTVRNESSAPKELTSFNNKLYFTADAKRWNGFGLVGNRELWNSNGSETGTKMLADLNVNGSSNSPSGPVGLKVWKNKLYFFALGSDGKQNLYETDGTESGTKQVTTAGFSVMVNYGRNPGVFTEFKDALYFTGNDLVNGYELWKTDGTAAGTVMVKEINPAKGMFDSRSEISQLTVMGDHLYFLGNETSDDDSLQLWKTDGTTAGTQQVMQYKIDDDKTVNSLAATGTHLYYTVRRSIWRTDGTTAGTALFLADCEPYHLTSFNGQLLFQTNTGNPTMAHICITSGEAQGYTILKDVAPNAINLSVNSTYYYPMNVADGKLYFSISIAGASVELWQSDGTVAGTSLIKTLAQADGGIPSQKFVSHNGEVYFTTQLNGKELLYKTNGTEAGTVKVTATGLEGINNLTSVDNVLFFTSGGEQASQTGEELWKIGTDTTSGGGGGTTGLKQLEKRQVRVSVYPNPACDNVSFYADEQAGRIEEVVLYDLTGRMLEKITTGHEWKVTHDVSGYNNGTYLCRITTGKGTILKRVIIAR